MEQERIGMRKHKPMPLIEVLEKVQEGCEMHMNQLDNDGYCKESDDYVVALAFLEDHLEKLRAEKHSVDTITDLLKKKHD